MQSDITVELVDRVYALLAPLVFDAADSPPDAANEGSPRPLPFGRCKRQRSLDRLEGRKNNTILANNVHDIQFQMKRRQGSENCLRNGQPMFASPGACPESIVQSATSTPA
jgi:hypothetical protein